MSTSAPDAVGRRQLLVGATVHPLDGADQPREALVIGGDGRVAGTGTRADMVALAGPDAVVVDLDGAVVLPGLVDTHPHVLHFGARERAVLDISDCRDHAEIVERVRARAAVTPPGEWIVTNPVGEAHYYVRRSYLDLAERSLPDRHVLDRATTDHPVHIEAWAPRTPNVAAFNTAGLRRCRLTDSLPDRVCDVWFDKDDAGSLTGVVRGAVNNYYCFDPFWTQVRGHLPGPQTWELHDATVAEMAAYNARGITTGFDGHNMSPAHIGAWRDLRATGRMTMRMLCAMEGEGFAYPPWQPLTLDQYRANLALGGSLVDLDDDLLRVSGVTWGQAGPCWPGGIRMHDAYRGPFGEPTRGMTFLSADKLAAFVDFCLGEQVQANFVTSGYRDHDDILAELAGRSGVRAAATVTGWLVQHAILITEAQARAYHQLGFKLTTCMGFSAAKGDLYGERIGPWVWRDQVPLRRLLRVGLTVGCGSDWGPKNPWENLALAETHEFWGSGRRNDGPDHAVSRSEALRMWTVDAADVLGWDGIGSLRPGAWADVIAVDRDPLRCDLEDLGGTQVLRTWLGGRLVHEA